MKTIDFTEFEKAAPDFLANIARRNPQNWTEFNRELSLYCACISLPVIVAVNWSKVHFPAYAKELEEKERVLREFYNYEN